MFRSVNAPTTPDANSILVSLTAAMTEAMLEGKTTAAFAELKLAFVGADRLAISGEGVARARTLKALHSTLAEVFGDAITTGTDKWEEWTDGVYSCVWVDLSVAAGS